MIHLFAMTRYAGVLTVSATLVACSGAEWKRAQVAPGYRAARQLNVTVVASTSGDDLQEAVDEFTTTLREELMSKGIGVTMASSKAAAPGAQLSVTEWNPGSRALRYFVGFGSGEGHMTVAVDVTRADGAPAVQGEVRGYVKGGMWGGSSLQAPREAAKSIAGAIATGHIED